MQQFVLLSLLDLSVLGLVFIGALAHSSESEAEGLLIPVADHQDTFRSKKHDF